MLGGCASKPAKSEGMQMEFRVPVTVAKATVKSVPVQVEVIGNVEAYSNVSVRTQIAGEIERAYFTQGQDVKKGQLLFTLDRRPFQATLDQLEANLARDQAQLANARAQAERNDKLFQAGIISKDQYDTFRTTAQAQEATVRADQAAIENAKMNLSYCSIYSPLDGRTGSYQVYPGNIAKVNDTVLVVINQIHPIYVTFAVPEQYLAEVKEYQARGPLAVEAQIPNDPRPPALGQLTFIDNAVDTATGTIKMRATFPNPDNRLWPGQFVNVVMRLTMQPNATVVPSQSVQTGPSGQIPVRREARFYRRPPAGGRGRNRAGRNGDRERCRARRNRGDRRPVASGAGIQGGNQERQWLVVSGQWLVASNPPTIDSLLPAAFDPLTTSH